MNRLIVLTTIGLSVLSANTHALSPPNKTEEASDTSLAREAYFALRRSNPYDVNFDAAAARMKAYQQFESAVNDPAARASIAAQLHTEVWQALGPAPIVGGQTPTSATADSRSAVSGRANAIAIDAIDNAVYIGGAQAGVWRSLNHGYSWTPLTDNLGSLAVGAIAIAPGNHPLNQATIYLGTGEGNFSGDSYAGVGVYKSTDSGRTWQGPYGTAQLAGRSIATLAVDSANPQVVLAGTSLGVAGIEEDVPLNPPSRGIYRSTDGGVTWAKVLPAPAVNLRISRIIQDPDPTLQTAGSTRYWAAAVPTAASAGALFVSNDSGATWTRVDGVATGLPQYGASGFVRTWITSTFNATLAKTVLYYGVSDAAPGSSGGILYSSLDGGTTWTNRPAANGFCQGQCTYDMPVYVEPGSATNVYTGGAGDSGSVPSSFMLSTDGGATFNDEMVGVDGKSALHADIHDITTWPGNPSEVWVVNDGGVYYSTDRGQHWTSANTNLAMTQFQICDLHPTDKNQAYGGTQDNGTDSFLGAVSGPVPGQFSWTHSDDGDGGFALINQSTPNLVTHTYYNISLAQIGASLATNGPASQPADYQYFAGDEFYSDGSPYLTAGIDGTDNVLFYAPMHLDRANNTTLYFGTQNLYIANDYFNQTITQENALTGNPPYTVNIYTRFGGATDFSTAPPPSALTGVISSIETPPSLTQGTNSTTIFVGTTYGTVWRSTDSGATFNPVDTATATYVSQIAVYPRNPQIVVASHAGFKGGLPANNVRISIDGGATWSDASNGLPDIPVNSIAWDPTFPGQLWAGTDIGIYLSSDRGATWHPYNNGMPNVAVFSLVSNHATDEVLACTHGRGAFRLNLDAIFIDGYEGN